MSQAHPACKSGTACQGCSAGTVSEMLGALPACIHALEGPWAWAVYVGCPAWLGSRARRTMRLLAWTDSSCACSNALEDPWVEARDDMYTRSVSPETAPDKATYIDIEFEKGDPVAIDGRKLSPASLLTELNKVRRRGGELGVASRPSAVSQPAERAQ